MALEEKPYAHWFLLNDADSMCLDPNIPAYLYEDAGIFWSNVLCHEEEHQEDDHPNFNPPYFCSREVLQKLLDAAEEVKGDLLDTDVVLHNNSEDARAAYERTVSVEYFEPHDWGQAIDGWYTHLVMNVLDLPWQNYADGASTWPKGRAGLFEGVKNGAVMVHGIKTNSDLMMAQMNRSNLPQFDVVMEYDWDHEPEVRI
jgi:hypothetical protein